MDKTITALMRKILSSVFQLISAAIYMNQIIPQFYLSFVLSVFSICYRQSLVYNPPCMLQFKKEIYSPSRGEDYIYADRKKMARVRKQGKANQKTDFK